MKIVNVMVSSINGKITQGNDPDITKWTSDEDGEHFRTMIENAPLIVMGSTTYEAAKASIKFKEGQLRVILTHNPENYKDERIPGKLEFSSESPRDLVKRLESMGYTEMLLAGGGEINKLFYEESLVTDLYLTIEPTLFGQGKVLVGEGDFFLSMRLQSVKQLNEQGTLLLHYCVQ